MTEAKPARRGKPARGSDRALSKELVLAGALELIDEIGVEKFSVRALAQRMNVFPSAIYWWVPTRNAVLAEVANYALADVMPTVDPADWKEWLHALFHAYRDAVRRHPNIGPVLCSQLLSNAGADLVLVDRILEVLSRAGFADDRLLEAFDVVVAAQVGFVSIELAATPNEDAPGFAEAVREKLATVDRATMPYLFRYRARMSNRHLVTRWDNGITVPLDASFDAHVYTVIEGLRQLLTR